MTEHNFLTNFFLQRYSWTKDGEPFDWIVFNDRMTQQPGRGTLVIKSPRDEDEGKHHHPIQKFLK